MTHKDDSISKVLGRLNLSQLGWEIVDHWDADVCAIGIGRPGTGRLVYISTFQKADGLYDYQCEVPSSDADSPFSTTDEGQDVSFERLLEVLSRHLGVK